MKKACMLCLGPKKCLSSLRLKLTTQGMAQHTNDQSLVWYHSAIQAPPLKEQVKMWMKITFVQWVGALV